MAIRESPRDVLRRVAQAQGWEVVEDTEVQEGGIFFVSSKWFPLTVEKENIDGNS